MVSVKSKEGIFEIIKFSSQGTVGGNGLQSGGGDRKEFSAVLFFLLFCIVFKNTS